jgi:hypothetical protein
MDISQNLLIDIGLDVIGYLAAGMLSVIIYTTFFTGRSEDKKSSSVADSAPGPSIRGGGRSAIEETTGRRRMEFVSLVDRQRSAGVARFASRTRTINPEHQARLQLLSTAKEMLDAGTPEGRIRKLLPISEGELALLMTGRNYIETGDMYAKR